MAVRHGVWCPSLIDFCQSVFYRKIPFRYKSVVEKPWTNTEDDNIAAAILTSREDKEEGEQNIAQLLEQIEQSSLDSPDNDSEEDYTNLKEDILPLNQKLQKINNNLIKQRTDKNGEEVLTLPKNILIEKEDILPKYTHLMAFRPDYTIRLQVIIIHIMSMIVVCLASIFSRFLAFGVI
uniref:Uncharacterized protein n=1 Tax=Meloidogyne incognita TaxID=6306 RepID=A0A914KV55_MELIC